MLYSSSVRRNHDAADVHTKNLKDYGNKKKNKDNAVST